MSVPKLRFKEFTPEYNEYELKTLLKSYRLGGNYSNSESKTNYPLIKMGNLNRGSINLSKIEYVPEDELIDSQDIIQFGDLFFNTRNTLDLVGKVAIWRNELPIAYYNSNLLKLEFENNFYMNFLLNTEKSLEKLKAIASGTTSVAAIYTKDLLKVKIIVPHVEEQTKIASFLSAVDEKISQLTQKHELLSQYKQGMMQKLFSQQIRFKADDGSEFGEWRKAKVGNITETIFGYPFDSKEMVEDNNGIPLMRGINIGECHIRHSFELDRFFLKDTSKLEKYFVRVNDIVLSMDGSKVGRNSAFVTEKDAGSLLVQRVCILREKENTNIQYVYQWIISKEFHRYVDQVKTSSGIPHISGKQIQDYEISYPCLEEQTKIANFLSNIDQKIEVVAQQIKQAKMWKKGLLQQMFV